MNNKENIWKRIDRPDENGCMNWLGYKNKKGYGTISWKSNFQLVHRVVWKLEHRKIPDGMCILHHCDNPSCCNPKHLWLGTKGDNNADRHSKGKSRGPRGEKNGSAKLKEIDVLNIYKLYKCTITQQEIAFRYSVSLSCIERILMGRSWTYLYRYFRK